MRFSNNKDFQTYIKSLVKSGDWKFTPKAHRKHGYLTHACGVKLPVPSSPHGDAAAFRNFKAAVRRIEKESINHAD